MNITTYNCSYTNGTHFNSTEPCSFNYDMNWEYLFFVLFIFGLVCIVCCPRTRNSGSLQIRTIMRTRERMIVREIEPNYSDYIISLDEQIEKDSVCVICFEELEKGVGKLENCDHQFHKKCIKRWLKEKPICPICRTDIY